MHFQEFLEFLDFPNLGQLGFPLFTFEFANDLLLAVVLLVLEAVIEEGLMPELGLSPEEFFGEVLGEDFESDFLDPVEHEGSGLSILLNADISQDPVGQFQEVR